MTITTWPVDAVSGEPLYSGRKLRQTTVSLHAAMGAASRPLGARSGIRPGTPDSIFTVSGNSWSVGLHAAVIDAVPAGEAGAYGYANDAVVTGTIDAAHASLTRWDLVYAELSDPAESAGTGAPRVEIKYLAGQADETPSNGFPATPARSFPLMRVVRPMNGGGNATAVPIAPFSAAAGGLVPFRSEAELRDWGAPNGTQAVALDTGNLFLRAGGAWLGGLVDLSTLALSSGIALSAGGGYIVRRGNQIELNVRITRTFKLVGSGAETLFTVPVGLRPANPEPVAIYVTSGVGRGFGWGFIDTNGLLTVAAPFMDSTSVTGAVTIVAKSVYKV